MVHFSLLIPKISMFTLATSCLATSSLSWIVDLIFNIPLKYCPLQQWSLFSPPDTSTLCIVSTSAHSLQILQFVYIEQAWNWVSKSLFFQFLKRASKKYKIAMWYGNYLLNNFNAIILKLFLSGMLILIISNTSI